LPETWYCPSCTIRSRNNTKKEQSQSNAPIIISAEQEAGSTAADTTVSSPDVPSSIAVKTDAAYEYDTDEFQSCKSSQSSEAQVDHKASVTKDDEDDGDGDKILARYGDKEDKEGGASANNNSNTHMNDTATRSTNNQEAGSTASSTTVGQSIGTADNVYQVIVEGCGVSAVNGTYTKVVGQMYNAPVYCNGNGKVIYRNSMVWDLTIGLLVIGMGVIVLWKDAIITDLQITLIV